MEVNEYQTLVRSGRPSRIYVNLIIGRISIWPSYFLAHTSISPNQVTLLSLMTGFLAVAMLASFSYWVQIAGVVIWYVALILDDCDGDIARYRKRSSDFGNWFERVSDRAKDIALLGAVSWLAFLKSKSSWIVWVEALAVGGTVLHWYSIAYGFKAIRSEQSAPASNRNPIVKFGLFLLEIRYAVMAVCIILGYAEVFLIFVAAISAGAIILNVYSTWNESRTT